MPKLAIDIDKSQLDEVSKEIIASKDKEIKKLTNQLKIRDKKIAKLSEDHKAAQQIIERGTDFARDIVELTDMYGDFQYA